MSEQKIQVGDVWLNADGYEVRIAPRDGAADFDAVRIDGAGVYTVNAIGLTDRMGSEGDLVLLVSRTALEAAPTLGQSLTPEERVVAAERAAHAPGKPPIQAGDVWADGVGKEYTISPNNIDGLASYPWKGSWGGEFSMFSADGHWFVGKESPPHDLVRLVSRATPPKADTIPCPPPEPTIGELAYATRGPMGPEARTAFEAPPSLDLQQRLALGTATLNTLGALNHARLQSAALWDMVAVQAVEALGLTNDGKWTEAAKAAKDAQSFERTAHGNDRVTTTLFRQFPWWQD